MSTSKDKEKLSDEVKNEIKTQVEYYLSDENLKKDAFFHGLISSDANGYLDLDYLLKCNKIKKAGWTKEELIEGIKLSDIVELDNTNNKVRRKDNKPLPELVLLSKKRPKPEKEEEKEEKEREPIVLMFESEKESTSKWKDVCQAFRDENPDLNVIYSRFKDQLGHIVVIPDSDDDIKFKDKFSYDEVEYKVKKCEGDDLINFYKVKINKEKKKDVKINHKNFINNPGSKVGVLNENIGKDNNAKFNKMPKQIMRRKDFSRQFEQINHGYKKNK